MPEYPDITIYIERLEFFARDRKLQKVRIANPFFLRTADISLSVIEDLKLATVERIGKRIVFGFPDEIYLVLHLMISGRLYWRKSGCKIPFKKGLAALDFEKGTLLITEVATHKRASLHIIQGTSGLKQFQRGGLEIFKVSLEEFSKIIRSVNHTLKRALTDPRIISGVGNAFSDEILHHACLSPVTLTSRLTENQIENLYHSIKKILTVWTDRLREQTGDGFPEKVTAFRPEMAVHGKYGHTCPVCNTPVQRIRYATNETNYCPRCQTNGRILADRSLSRLLKSDWPRTIEELEEINL